ncbi:MAG: DNA repair protein RadA [bacterium]|nr:DNA repair protein RadA [bacterium]
MASSSHFICTSCDYRSAKWLGRCPSCGAWETMTEREARPRGVATRAKRIEATPFPDITGSDAQRASTGIEELDRVLGGGLVAGAVILLGGEPGVGKSTLALQAAAAMAAAGRRVLYVSGEESAAQVRRRGERLDVTSAELLVAAETDVGAVVAGARELAPVLVVVDSIQAVRCAEIGSLPGSVAQVRESAGRIVELAKSSAIPVVLVGHVTKEGTLAGPRVLEHLVDVVVQFEGQRHHAHRVLRALKNRFGATDELGVFRMTDRGLAAVPDPSELFVGQRPVGAPGSAVLPAIEGSRPLLLEIQALVGEPTQGTPRRSAVGVDSNRVAMILAVLQRRAGVDLVQRDVFVNVTGGVSVVEPAADLAVAAAIASSASGAALPDRWVVAGEIGLTGEVRAVSRTDARLREAARLGFDAALVPESSPTAEGIERIPVRRLDQALERLLG